MRGFFSREDIQNKAVKHIEKDECNCLDCGLHRKCRSPKMKVHGDGKLNTLLLAEAPGKNEDKYNEQLVGQTGDFLRMCLLKFGFQLKRDFFRLNAVNCRPMNKDRTANRTPTSHEIECCRPMVFKTIQDLDPKFVILFGAAAVESMLGQLFDKMTIGRWRGTKIPDQTLKRWLMPLYHPSYPNRNQRDRNLNEFFNHDLKHTLNHIRLNLEEDFPIYDNGKSSVVVLTDFDSIISVLDRINTEENIIHIDYETSGLKPYIPGHKIASLAITLADKVYSMPFEYASFFTNKQRLLIKRGLRKIWKNENIRKVAHNAKFEHIWTTNILKVQPANWHWCTLQGAHIQDNRQGWSGLKFQTYINFGYRPWGNSVDAYLKSSDGKFNKIDQCPLDDLLLYGGLDVYWTRQLYLRQADFYSQSENSGLRNAFNLFNEGSIVLAEIQDNGVNVDEEYCHSEQIRYQKRIEVIERNIYTSEEAKLFKNSTGRDFAIRDKDFSDDDLRILFYNLLQYKSSKKTESRQAASVDEGTLRHFDNKIADLILKRRKFRKIEGTYLSQFIRETYYGKMNPFFNLIIPVSYRGSSSDPNFQNIPKRDKEAKKATRRAIIPSSGNQLLESDFSGIEVCINACYNHDPTLIANITNPKNDMHRDSAADIWNIAPKDVSKDLRFYAKNQWVFPQFYGSWYFQCAQNLWRTAIKENLTTNNGQRAIEIAYSKGITTFEAFVDHCAEVERKFWEERFKVYNQWKTDIQTLYQKQGYLETFLGFRFNNYMGRNELTNYPAQGTAFHILLWTLINVHKELKAQKMKSKIIGQIHDSMITDAVPKEVKAVIEIIDYWGTVKTRENFDWITVPLKIDHELTDINESWYTKKEMK